MKSFAQFEKELINFIKQNTYTKELGCTLNNGCFTVEHTEESTIITLDTVDGEYERVLITIQTISMTTQKNPNQPESSMHSPHGYCDI